MSNMGSSHGKKGQLLKAIEQYEQALRLGHRLHEQFILRSGRL
jgi:hypothetical protein